MESSKAAGIDKYPDLFAPRKIGKFTAPNSVKYAACSVSNFNNLDGSITEREMERMRVICQTGAGIITNQGAYPDAEGLGKAYFRQVAIHDDKFLGAFARIADMVHENGALAVQQILHAGRYGGINTDYSIGPSEVQQSLPHFRPPRAMSVADIKACIQQHADASSRSIRAGFDGVEVTAFMGYLLANFLSPYTNKREDEYGGSFANRGRFMVELIESIKDAIGDNMFWIRLNATELMDDRGGNTEDECLEYMKLAEAAGVDGISIVIGWHESTKGALGRDLPTDQWLYLAERVKKEIQIPVAFGPRFGDPILANQALADGKIDFWEVCRPFLADPELLIKVREDRVREIKPCVGGLMCLSRMFRNLPYVCSMNPRLGHEYEPEYTITKTTHEKNVFVIGGGPAGIEAAVTAAKKGHRVTLFEKSSQLGGQLRAASNEIAGGHVFLQLLDHYDTQLEKYGVEVKLDTELNWRQMAKIRPDVGIVACGAMIQAPSLPGIEGLDAGVLILADHFSEQDYVSGKTVAVLGGDRAGLVVAERLAQEGNEVFIIDGGRKVAHDVIPTFKWRHISWLKQLGIEVLRDSHAVAVDDGGLRIRCGEDEESVRPFDLLVVSGPRQANNALTGELGFCCDELYTVGDAVLPRNVCDAVHEGFKIGARI